MASCSSASSPVFAVAAAPPASSPSSSSLLLRSYHPAASSSLSSSPSTSAGLAMPLSPSKRKVEAGTGIEQRLAGGGPGKRLKEDKGKSRAVEDEPTAEAASQQGPQQLPQQQQQAGLGSASQPSVVYKELPHDYIHADAEDLVLLIASMLTKLIGHNDQVPLRPDDLTRFHSRSPPGISVVDYLRRIVRYTNIEKSPLLILLPYLDAFCAHLPSFTLSSLTVHRFLISSACVASKAICDSFCTNSHYAKVGGIKVDELNLLERELISGLGWKLNCEASLLQSYYTSLITSYSTPHTLPNSDGTATPPQTLYTQAPPPPPPPAPAPPPYLPWPSLESLEGTSA